MTTLAETGNVNIVNVGLSPNDGTGDNIRKAFIKTNETITTIASFLEIGPSFTSANISGPLVSDTITSNVGTFNTLIVNSTVPSVSSNTGSFISKGGVGIAGDLHIDGTIFGTVHGNSIVTGSLMVSGGAGIVGNVQAGPITTASLVVAADAVINGSLTVFGNITTVTNSELVIMNPIIEIGGAANATLSYNDGKDRGIEFAWFDTVANVQQKGFFGFQNATGKFTMIPDSTYVGGGDSDIFAGAYGIAQFTTVEADIISVGTSTFEIIDANAISVTSGITGELITSSQPNITELGTLSYLNVATGNVAVSNGNINVTGGTVYINGSPVSTSAEAFHGGTVALDTEFSSTTISSSPYTGAVTVAGGVGILGDLNVGGILTTQGFAAVTLYGTLATPAQPNVTSVGTLSNLDITNSLSAHSININNLTAGNFVNASFITATTGLNGTLQTTAQPNITSVGTLSALSVSGNITASNFVGSVVGNVTGNVSGSALTVTASDQPAITSVGVLTSLTSAGQIQASSFYSTGTISSVGNISTPTGSVVGTYLYGQVRTAAQPQITSLGSLTGLTNSGVTTLVGTTTLGSTLLAAGSGTQAIGSSANRFGTVYSTGLDNTGITTTGGLTSSGNVVVSTIGKGLVFSDGTVMYTAASGGGAVTSVAGRTGAISLTDADVSGLSNSATIAAATTNTASTIVLRDSSGNFSAGVVTATATNARYADLAEKYQSDGEYEPGTVMVFGGSREVTLTGSQADVSVAGVVSTAPAYLMNIDEPNSVAIALRGKVPVKVIGTVKKGDLLVTSYVQGHAVSVGKDGSFGVAIFAKSLEDSTDQGPKLINAVII